MTSLCLYFQVHQPYRIKDYTFFDVAHHNDYFDTPGNVAILNKVSRKCYLPANETFYDLIKKYNGQFKIALSFSGVFLEQLEAWRPDVLYSFKKLIDTGCVEILAETYYHSLSAVYSAADFEQQVLKHERLVQRLFNVSPKVFRNTELIYSNALAAKVQEMGYKGILAEGIPALMTAESANFVHHPVEQYDFPVLLKNYKLSDDIAFRFSNADWSDYPLTAEKFAHWTHQLNTKAETINIFMDYETFGEHQWEITGIFEFLKYLPQHVLAHPDFNFKTPSEVIDSYPLRGSFDSKGFSSWADTERDLSAWAGNPMQKEALRRIYRLEPAIKEYGDTQLLDKWRKLTISDHFYYMSTKDSGDGEVHTYFSPYDSPLMAYNNFINAVSDLEYRLSQIKQTRTGEEATFVF